MRNDKKSGAWLRLRYCTVQGTVQSSHCMYSTIVQCLIRVERFRRKKMGRHGDVAAHWERFQKQKDSNSLRFESGISHTERKNQSEQAGPQCDALKSF